MESNPSLAPASAAPRWRRVLATAHNIITWPFTWAAVTHLAYWVSISPLSKLLLPLYIRICAVAVEEAAKPSREYPTLAAFFQRQLKPGLRPICPEPAALVSPVDGQIVDHGEIRADRLFKAKGVAYALSGLLGDDVEAKRFIGGSFVIIYMSAGAYHRVHSPCDAEVCAARFLPGRHFPLYALSQRSVPDLYSRNTRQVNYLRVLNAKPDTKKRDEMALVQIGSALVGSIQNNFQVADITVQKPCYAKGEEIGRFAFGSTVILVLPPSLAKFDAALVPGSEVKVGQKIAVFNEVQL